MTTAPNTQPAQPLHEQIADAILRAAGSGFRYYMPDTKLRIIEAAEKVLASQTPVPAPVNTALPALSPLVEAVGQMLTAIYRSTLDDEDFYTADQMKKFLIHWRDVLTPLYDKAPTLTQPVLPRKPRE